MASVGTLPPATPAYIFRGHSGPVHALHFYKRNAFLISADSDGWVIVWSLTSKRSVGCWRAHEGSILAIKSWGDNVITHGRDHKLRVWQLSESSLSGDVLDVRFPGSDPEGEEKARVEERREPWLLHSMAVSALNFCAFAMCGEYAADDASMTGGKALLALPNALDMGAIDFFQLPSENRLCVLRAESKTKTGMVMALDLFTQPGTGLLIVVSAYEDGHTIVHRRKQPLSLEAEWIWEKILAARPHGQPILSLDSSPSKEVYFTSSADALIARVPVPAVHVGTDVTARAMKTSNTKHAGQQDLTVRDDGKIFATAGWDARIRVYSCKTLKEVAVLKWHKQGCCSIAFAETSFSNAEELTPHSVALKPSQPSALDKIKYQRSSKAQEIHWLAAGGKDSKISLWNIY